jgi:uncharacterized protein YkwD
MRTRKGLARALALAATLAAAAAATPQLWPGSPTPAQAAVGDCTPGTDWGTLRQDLATQVVQLVNQHRASLGLAQLVVTTPLTNAAIWKSRHMAYYRYMQHNDPAPPVARTPSDRLLACGYPSTSAGWGENIAYGYPTASAVMQGWLNSPGHRANIENASFRAIGVSAAAASTGTLYWTQQFGTSTTGGSTTTPPPSPTPTPTPTPTPAPTTVSAAPGSVSINAGSYLSGGIASLAADDGVHLRLSTTTGSTLWWGRFTGVPNTLKTLSITSRGLSSAVCTQTISAWDWTAGVWRPLATRAVGATESETVVPVGGTLASYVFGSTGNGDVAVRVGCAGTGAFTTSDELLRIVYTP